MSHKKLQKKQSPEVQSGMQENLQAEQSMQLWYMPHAEAELKIPKRKIEEEIETIEKKLEELSEKEHQTEETIRSHREVMETLCKKYRDAKEKVKQNPESEEDQDIFYAQMEVYGAEQKEVEKLIKQLFHTKHEKIVQLRKHQIKMMICNGEKITDEWSDQTAADGLENMIRAFQDYNEEPWKFCVDNLQETMEKLQHAHRGYMDRIEMTKTAKRMAEETEDYSHKQQLLEWTKLELPSEEVLDQYLGYVNQIWTDEKKRKIYLSPEYITHHIRESFFLIDYYLFSKSRRKNIKISKEQKIVVEKADRIMNYYHEHVKNILNDYGMEMSKMKYDRKKMENASKKEGMGAQAVYWRKDFLTYQELTGESRWEVWNPRKEDFAEDAIIRLEEQFGINHVELKSEAELHGEEKPEELVEKQNGYYRYKSNLLDGMADFQSAVAKKARVLRVGQVMMQDLKKQGIWNENSAFHRVLECLRQDDQHIKNINRKNYKAYEVQENIIRERLMEELHRILKMSNSSLEKQYAAELLYYVKKEQDGDLVLPKNKKSILYRPDKFFELEHIEGQVDVSMKSVKEQPLFSHDPILKDIEQGKIGDCYFLAALTSLVVRSPGKIKEIMRDNGDGTVTVRFYDHKEKNYMYVKVDKTVPEATYASGLITARGARRALWVKLLEKAYVSVRNRQTGFLTNRSKKCTWDDAAGGQVSTALTNLTGLEANLAVIDENDFSIFKGRLKQEQKTENYKLDTPALLYYEETHKGDKEAFDYLNQHRVSRRKAAKLKAELERNDKVEELLKKLMMQEKHEMEINTMDRKEFGETMAKAYGKLVEYASIADTVGKEGQPLSIEDLSQTNIPESMRDLLTQCWNLCGQKKKALEYLAFDMVEVYMRKISTSGVKMEEYTEWEEEFYQKIENIVKENRFCGLGTEHFNVDENHRQVLGYAGEHYLDGLFAGHAYTVIRTEVHKIGNKEKKFLRVVNPHGKTIPLYRLGDDNKLKRVGFMPKEWDEDAEQYEESSSGVFLIELRDAKNFFKVVFNTI